jgi:hypothetical protein
MTLNITRVFILRLFYLLIEILFSHSAPTQSVYRPCTSIVQYVLAAAFERNRQASAFWVRAVAMVIHSARVCAAVHTTD